MKKMLLSLFLLPAFAACLAQTRPDTVKTVFTKPVQTSNQKQTLKTTAPNKIVEKLPDLRITAATVTATNTSPGAYKLTVRCTIKNDGNVSISYDDIDIRGLLAAEKSLHLPLNATAYSPACGISAAITRGSLAPGESISREYYCFNRVMSPSDKPVYILLINHYSNIKEPNKENNKQNIYVTFE